MAGSLPNVRLVKGTYYVYVQIPADVQSVLNQKSFWKTLNTGNFHDARKFAPPIIAGFKRQIATARTRKSVSPNLEAARRALAKWAAHEEATDPIITGEIPTPWATMRSIELLNNAAATPDGYLAIEGFDEFLASVLTLYGCRATRDSSIIAAMRQEAAIYFTFAAKRAEQLRIAGLLKLQIERTLTDLDIIGEKPFPAPPQNKPPTITIKKLFDDWIAHSNPAEKERGRLNHEIRRLIEFCGDKPANYLTTTEVVEFFGLVARLPKRRSAKLNALTIRDLVGEFENSKFSIQTKNAKILNSNSKIKIPTTLTKTTVGEWFVSYRRMYAFGKIYHNILDNPFDIDSKLVVRGEKPLRRRQFSKREIEKIFSAPLFTGFARENPPHFETYQATALSETQNIGFP